MNGFIAKVARLAVSKAAAFGYAVAVGVAGNIAFHYVEPHAVAPQTSASVAVRPAPEDTASTPPPSAAQPAQSVAARPEPKPPAPSRPAEPRRAIAAAPVLPEPPTKVDLPRTDALLSPVLRPAVLPRQPATSQAALPAPHPDPVPGNESAAATPASAAPATAASVTLPPLGPVIEVDAAPTPPDRDAPPIPAPRPAAISSRTPVPIERPATEPRSSLEISDLWHPGRAVRRGLHWAGRQVPFGDDDGDREPAPHHASLTAPHAAVSAPIPLLPAASDPVPSGPVDAALPPRKPLAPGPGSGGLY